MAIETTASVDYASLVTNLGIFITFVVAATVGIWQGIKKIRRDDAPSQITPQNIKAAMLMENMTLSEWSQTNREVTVALAELKRATYHHCECLTDHKEAMVELAHQIELQRVTGK